MHINLIIIDITDKTCNITIAHTRTNQCARSLARMKYLNLEADSVYGYLIWVIRFEIKKGLKKKLGGYRGGRHSTGGHFGTSVADFCNLL